MGESHTREQKVAAGIAALIADAEDVLDSVASDLTELYRRSIPVYDSVEYEEVHRNTRAVLEIAVAQVRRGASSVDPDEVAALIRRWTDPSIPLELVAHSIQLGARALFSIIRGRATEQNVPPSAIDDMQDVIWEWATAYSGAVNTVMRERAVSGATRRADLVRHLVEGSYVPATLDTDAREHGIDCDHRYRVAVAMWDDSPTMSDVRQMVRIRCSTAALPVVDAVIDGRLIALLPTVTELAGMPVAVGVGHATSIPDVRSSFDRALRALDLARRFGRSGLVDLTSLGPLALLGLGEDAAEQLEATHLAPLVERGAAGREIVDTVAAFLDHDRRVEDTAAALFVHRNTVRNRVARFGALTGLDIDTTSDLVLVWWLIARERAARCDTSRRS